MIAQRQRRNNDEDMRSRLASAGLRVTEQRIVLLGRLARQKRPVTHAELTQWLADNDMDRATIYRNLVALSESGLLVRSQLGDGVWRYELPKGSAQAHGDHAHFVCNECGDVTCLAKSEVALRGKVARNEVTEVQLRGRCATCRRP